MATSHPPATSPRRDHAWIALNAALPSLMVVLILWPLARQTDWRNYWFDDRYLYSQAALMQEQLGLLGDKPSELDAVRDRMPLYPLLLRGLNRLQAWTRIPVPAWSILVNVLAHALGCIVLFHLVLETTADRHLARIAALLWPWLPGVVPYTLAQLPEAVSTTLGLTCGYLILRVQQSVASSFVAGSLLGLATLFKPVFCYFCFPALLLLAWSARRTRRPAWGLLFVFLVAFLLPVSSWVARNHNVWGTMTLTPNGNAHLANVRDHLAADLGLPPPAKLPSRETDRRALGIDQRSLPEFNADRSRDAWLELRDRLPAVIGLAAQSLIKFHAATGVGALWTMSHDNLAIALDDHQPDPRQANWSFGWNALQGVALTVLAVVYLLGLLGLYTLWKMPTRRLLLGWALLTLAYFVVISVPFGNTRYRYPTMPAYAVLAAAGVVHILQRWTKPSPA